MLHSDKMTFLKRENCIPHIVKHYNYMYAYDRTVLKNKWKQQYSLLYIYYQEFIKSNNINNLCISKYYTCTNMIQTT